jgi:hypothetical protein
MRAAPRRSSESESAAVAQARVFALIVVRQPQRQAVSLPANALGFRVGNHARRMWQYDLAGRQARSFRAERHLQFLFRTGKRARRLRT